MRKRYTVYIDELQIKKLKQRGTHVSAWPVLKLELQICACGPYVKKLMLLDVKNP